MKFSASLVIITDVFLLSNVAAFVPHAITTSRPTFVLSTKLSLAAQSSGAVETLFEEDEEIIPIAENYLRAKYQATIQSHGHDIFDKEDAKEILRTILPPVTHKELDEEVSKTLNQFPGNKITEDDFVNALMGNTYWQNAGSLVVKELIYFDALYAYYKTGKSLLNNDDYETLKDNLSWEGSSVATMSASEALFVTAIASNKRGQPIMGDNEYSKLKADLVKEKSWVTARGQDALEKLGLNTFLGYLHRAL